MDGRKILQLTSAGIGVVIVIGYSCFVLYGLVRGPRILIDSPLTGYSTTTPFITIVGRGIHTNNVTVNGAQTAVDLEGNFRNQLILAPGYNIITITAKDNYKRTAEKKIEMVLVVPPLSATTTPSLELENQKGSLSIEQTATTTTNTAQ